MPDADDFDVEDLRALLLVGDTAELSRLARAPGFLRGLRRVALRGELHLQREAAGLRPRKGNGVPERRRPTRASRRAVAHAR